MPCDELWVRFEAATLIPSSKWTWIVLPLSDLRQWFQCQRTMIICLWRVNCSWPLRWTTYSVHTGCSSHCGHWRCTRPPFELMKQCAGDFVCMHLTVIGDDDDSSSAVHHQFASHLLRKHEQRAFRNTDTFTHIRMNKIDAIAVKFWKVR